MSSFQIIFLSIAFVLIMYGNYRKHRKDKIDAAKKEEENKKILDYYKSIYTPIKKDKRLPTIKRDGFILEDIAKNATEFLYKAPIPTFTEIQQLKKGDLIKLNFEDEEGDIERMWVEYVRYEDELHLGLLRNDSYDIQTAKFDREIWFHSNHILLIDKEE